MWGLIALYLFFATAIFILVLARVAFIISCCGKHIAHAETSEF
jgi:hypothetical protein